MIRRKISLLLAILMVISTMAVGFTPVSAGSDDGITTDTSAPYDEYNEYEEISKPKQKNTVNPDAESQQIQRESLYTKTVDNGDGTKTLEVYGEPVRYEANDGSVKDISLVPVAKDNGFTTGDHFIYAEFPEKIESGILLRAGDYNVKTYPVSEAGTEIASSSAYLKNETKIVYTQNKTTSYEYNITYSGYKENIVVSEYTGQTDYYFRIETDGLLLVASEGDPSRGAGLELKDAEGRTAARIGNIIVFSSDNRNNIFGSVGFETVTEGDEYIIRISVPEAYLSDPATHYPIYIDPSLSAQNEIPVGTIEDITVNQNQAADPPNYGTLYVGKAGSDYGAMRSVMRFPQLNLCGISPNSIISAKVNVRDLMCYGYQIQVDCYGYGGTLPTGAFTTSNITWSAVYNTMQYYESNNVYRSTNNVSYNIGYYHTQQFWYDFDILPVVQSWAQGRNAGTLAQTDQAIVFKATDTYEQSTSEQYVCFGSYEVVGEYKPSLSIVVSYGGGDDYSDADEMTLNNPVTVYISEEYERKYFSFEPAQTGFYTFESINAFPSDPQGSLYNVNTVLLASNDDAVQGNYNFSITYHLRAGVVYYYSVGCYEDETGTFGVTVQAASAANFEQTEAASGNSYTFSNSLAYQAGCYYLNSGSAVEIMLFSTDKTADPYVWVYSSSLTLIASDDDGAGNQNFRTVLSLSANQSYYVVVGNKGNGTGSFKFTVAYDPGLETAVYYVKNMGTEYYTAIDGPAAETYICQATLAGVAEQKWTITKQNDGYYTVRSGYGSEKYMGVTGSGTGTNNVQLQSSVTDSARWKIYRTSGGSVLFEPKTAPGKTLYVPGTSSGTKYQLIQMYVYDSTSDKKSVFYVTRGYGEQEFRPLDSNQYSSYNCMKYALNMSSHEKITEHDDIVDPYIDILKNSAVEPLVDETSPYYSQVKNELAEFCKDEFVAMFAESGLSGMILEEEISFTGNGDYRPLDINQYRIVLRTGVHVGPPGIDDGVLADEHFWYQTKDGTWANKHGDNAPEHLSSGVTPSSVLTSGWTIYGISDFYDSPVLCFIITVN